jgi:hypothetical protein
MVTKDIVKSEIEKVPQERLEELYQVVKSFTSPAPEASPKSFMAKLRELSIDGPEDFSANVDLYLSEEKDFATKSVQW